LRDTYLLINYLSAAQAYNVDGQHSVDLESKHIYNVWCFCCGIFRQKR